MLRVTADEAVEELTRSLAMVCPTGMTEEDRTQWIAAAASTIREADIGPKEFGRAASKARLDPTCDHPAKIIPAIVRALGEGWKPRVVDLGPKPENEAFSHRQEAMESFLSRLKFGELTQEEVDAAPDSWREIAECRSLLTTQFKIRERKYAA